MSSSPDVGDPLTTTVKRVPEGRMSNWMNDTLAAGDTIDVMRPAGLFVLRPTDAPIVAFAGGSGITPVISIVKSALATTDRSITLVYANRGRRRGDLRRRARPVCRRARAVSSPSTTTSTPSGASSTPPGVPGSPPTAIDGDFYICGPGPYMDTVEAGLDTLLVPSDRLFIERFVVPEEAPGAAAAIEDATVVIKLGKKTHELAYRAGDTILDTARGGDLSPPFSCEAGSCATCMAHLDEGAVRMRVNNALTPEEVEEGWVLTCQSLPTSRARRRRLRRLIGHSAVGEQFGGVLVEAGRGAMRGWRRRRSGSGCPTRRSGPSARVDGDDHAP